jgi:hypothetical protein
LGNKSIEVLSKANVSSRGAGGLLAITPSTSGEHEVNHSAAVIAKNSMFAVNIAALTQKRRELLILNILNTPKKCEKHLISLNTRKKPRRMQVRASPSIMI